MAPNLSRCATLCLLSTTFISCYYAGIAAQDRPERSAAGPPTATDVVVRTEPWHLVHIPDPVARRATIAALETTSTRLANAGCRNILTDFEDRAGRSLAERLSDTGVDIQSYVAMVTFMDDTRNRQCSSGILAFTVPGSRVVRVCVDELKRIQREEAPEYLVAVFIHEILHTLGLGEAPPSSREITARVRARCG